MSIDLASPATPEAVYWAIELARSALSGSDTTTCHVPLSSPATAHQVPQHFPATGGAHDAGDVVNWVRAVERLRGDRHAGVLITISSVRGHAPREAGAKMVVAEDAAWDTIGGGNLEATAIARARELIADGRREPEILTPTLSDKALSEHGQQCCGGEVSLLLEPLLVVPSVAIFGLGHVGMELARILRGATSSCTWSLPRGALEPDRLRCSTTRWPASTFTTPPCPSWSWVRCRLARMCSS